MLQRYEHQEIQIYVETARRELQHDINDLTRMDLRNITNADSASFFLEMFAKLSSPAIGLQVMRNQLSKLKYPQMSQYDLIFDKAELFYVQSVLHDLNKLQKEDSIINITADEVRQCVQQINWKLNIERSTFLNESVEAGDNVDLMKFFEGVRNYQNWQEGLHKECIQRLKKRAHQVENQLTFRKGFVLSRLSVILNSAETKVKSALFSAYRTGSRAHKLFKFLIHFQKNQLKSTFTALIRTWKQPNVLQKLKIMLTRSLVKKCQIGLKSYAELTVNIKQKLQLLINKLDNIVTVKNALYQTTIFRLLDHRRVFRTQKIVAGINRINDVMKRKTVKVLLSSLTIPQKSIFNRLSSIAARIESSAMKEILQFGLSQPIQSPVSYHIKGKILLSLQKYQKSPMDMKTTFLKWYLNSYSQRFSKKVYNIWLQGNVSKFTVFMRLKNIIDLTKKHKISKQCKHFLRVLLTNYSRCEDHQLRTVLNKWSAKNRTQKKLEASFTKFSEIVSYYKDDLLFSAQKQLQLHYKRKCMVKQFCQAFLQQRINNTSSSLKMWKMLPDSKRIAGRLRMHIHLRKILEETRSHLKETYQCFHRCQVEGHLQKIKVCERGFLQDSFYLQKFLQIWRLRGEGKFQLQAVNKEYNSDSKTTALRDLSRLLTRTLKGNAENVIKKFRIFAVLKYRRQNAVKKTLIHFITAHQSTELAATFAVLASSLNIGSRKKQQLVTQYVQGHLEIMRASFQQLLIKAAERKQIEQAKSVQTVFETIQHAVKGQLSIFHKNKYLYTTLQKIVNNRVQNIKSMVDTMKTVPQRINWANRRKVLTLYQNLSSKLKLRLAVWSKLCKQNIIVGKSKKIKALQILNAQILRSQRLYLLRYRAKVKQIKDFQLHRSIQRFFQSTELSVKKNLHILLTREAIWKQKAFKLNQLNEYLLKRMSTYFLRWNKQTAVKCIQKQVTNEKKNRNLELLLAIYNKSMIKKSKVCIQLFARNFNIKRLQMNFLKRLCEGKSGKLLRGLMIWKNLPEPKNKERINRATKFQSSIQKLVIRNLKAVHNVMTDLHYMGNEAKKYCVRKLVARCSSGIGAYFQKWKNNKKLILLFQKCAFVTRMIEGAHNTTVQHLKILFQGKQGVLKLKYLSNIEQWLLGKKKLFFRKWQIGSQYKKQRIMTKKEPLLRLTDITSELKHRKINKIIFKFVKHCQAVRTQKKIVAKKGLIQAIERFEKLKRVQLNFTFDMYKCQHYKGNFKKGKAFDKYLQGKIKEVHMILRDWNEMSNSLQADDRRRTTGSCFSELDHVIVSNFSLLMAHQKQIAIKKKTLEQLFRIQEIKYRGMFGLWRARIVELKILAELNRTSKKMILEKISKIIEMTSKESVISAIRKFQINRKVQAVQKNFLRRLLQSKTGKLAESFNVWKSIPLQNLAVKYKKYQKLYFQLESLRRARLTTVQACFKDEQADGNTMKKQSILRILDVTSLGIRKLYSRWEKLTKRKKMLLTVNFTIQAMEEAQKAIQNQFLIIFQDPHAYQIKTAAVQRLIQATNNTTIGYFKKWQNNVQEIKVTEALGKEAKIVALKIFTKVVAHSQNGQVVEAIQKFNKNAKVVTISKNFFNRLMGTKTGKVIMLLQKMKSIPDAKFNKKKKKAIIFESKLNRFAQSRVRNILMSFKQSTYDANVKKKYCIDRLTRACMGENQKKYQLWRNIVREAKMLSHTEIFEKVFRNLHTVAQDGFSLIIKDAGKQVVKKRSLCRKLFNNASSVQHHAYLIWKQAYHLDNIKIVNRDSQVKTHLRNLSEVFANTQRRKSVQAINAFRKILQIRNLEEYNYYKESKNKRFLAMHANLCRMVNSSKLVFLDAIKSIHIETLFAERMKQMENMFYELNRAADVNAQLWMKNQRQSTIKERSMTRFVQNQLASLSKAVALWRQNTKILSLQLTMGAERQKNILGILTRLVGNKESDRISQAIRKFHLHLKCTKLQKQILLKILMTKSGKVPLLFMKWKALPNQNAKKGKGKAMRFESGIARMHFRRLKQTFELYKQQQQEGGFKKKLAIRKLITVTMSDSNRIFSKWCKINRQYKITNKIMHLEDAFENIQQAVKLGSDHMFLYREEYTTKVSAVTKLFDNSLNRLAVTFSLWRKMCKYKSQTLLQADKLLSKFNPFNRQLLRYSWWMISKKKQMEMLRGYINSLWKWKMSNLQASYYSKFLRVFRESEQLLSISLLLSRKFNENIHFAFRRLLQQGKHKTDRKKEICEKYLTRRARGYFVVFKQSTLEAEISIWKSKYTSSIKAKIMTDVLCTVFGRRKLQGCQTLKAYQEFIDKVKVFGEIVYEFERSQMKNAFDLIHAKGPQQFAQSIQSTFERVRQSRLKDSFNNLIVNWKALRFEEIVLGSLEKINKQTAFERIRALNERSIKAVLSLNLIEKMLAEKMQNKIRVVIQKLSNNRCKLLLLQKMCQMLSVKGIGNLSHFYRQGQYANDITRAMARYQKGVQLLKIVTKQETSLKKKYFGLLRQKKNIWIERSIKMFATRVSVRSSPAVCFWRMRTYAERQ